MTPIWWCCGPTVSVVDADGLVFYYQDISRHYADQHTPEYTTCGLFYFGS